MMRAALVALLFAAGCRRPAPEEPTPVAPPAAPVKAADDAWAKSDAMLEASLKKLEQAKKEPPKPEPKEEPKEEPREPAAQAPKQTIFEERPPPVGPAPASWYEGSDGLDGAKTEQRSSRVAIFVYFRT